MAPLDHPLPYTAGNVAVGGFVGKIMTLPNQRLVLWWHKLTEDGIHNLEFLEYKTISRYFLWSPLFKINSRTLLPHR